MKPEPTSLRVPYTIVGVLLTILFTTCATIGGFAWRDIRQTMRDVEDMKVRVARVELMLKMSIESSAEAPKTETKIPAVAMRDDRGKTTQSIR